MLRFFTIVAAIIVSIGRSGYVLAEVSIINSSDKSAGVRDPRDDSGTFIVPPLKPNEIFVVNKTASDIFRFWGLQVGTTIGSMQMIGEPIKSETSRVVVVAPPSIECNKWDLNVFLEDQTDKASVDLCKTQSFIVRPELKRTVAETEPTAASTTQEQSSLTALTPPSGQRHKEDVGFADGLIIPPLEKNEIFLVNRSGVSIKSLTIINKSTNETINNLIGLDVRADSYRTLRFGKKNDGCANWNLTLRLSKRADFQRDLDTCTIQALIVR